MTFDVMARVIARALQDPSHNRVEFIWHGGEPTLLGMSFYEKALVVQSYFRRPGQSVVNLIQSNATRLTAEWCRFLKSNGFGVGVSLDGPPSIHNQSRPYVGGRDSFENVIKGIELLERYGVSFSVLMVIDEAAYASGPGSIFDFFLKQKIKRYGVLFSKPTNLPNATPGTSTSHYIDPPRVNSFLIGLYNRWEAHGDRSICIREIDIIRKRILNTHHRPCTLVGGCFGNFFLIEPDGEIAHCDLFVDDAAYSLGNIRHLTFEQVRSSVKLQALRSENTRSLERMRSCPSFAVCNGWCPHERYISVRHNSSHHEECCGLLSLINHIREKMLKEVEVPRSTKPICLPTHQRRL